VDNSQRGIIARPLSRWWSRVLDGDRAWGSIDIWPSRYGVTRYRIVVFPPGITRTEHRLLRLWRAWPIWGAALWLVSEIVLSNLMAPLPAMMASTAGYLATGGITLAMANSLRSGVHSLSVMVIIGDTDPYAMALCHELTTLVTILTLADEQREQGLISTVDHEMVWWGAYDRTAPERLQLLQTPSEGARGV
jgi:hypothetical protein